EKRTRGGLRHRHLLLVVHQPRSPKRGTLSTTPAQHISDLVYPEPLISAPLCRYLSHLRTMVINCRKTARHLLRAGSRKSSARRAKKFLFRVFRLYACKGRNPLQAQHLIGMQPYSHSPSMPVWETWR